MTAAPLTAREAQKLEAALCRVNVPPEAAVIYALWKSGLKIGDVLAMGKRAVARAMQKRPAYESTAWTAIKLNWTHGHNCAEGVCPAGLHGGAAGFCAYQKCRRYLSALGRELKIEGLNFQRIRATVVARLLAAGVSADEIQTRLGYKSLRGVQYHKSRAVKARKHK